MRKKRDTLSILSSGSRKILHKKNSTTRVGTSRNTSPSFVNMKMSENGSSIPGTIDTNMNVHERLHKEHNLLKLKKDMLASKYSYSHHKSSQSLHLISDLTRSVNKS